MAEQATKEPTMEEILASIRRIISEDGSPVGEALGEDVSGAPDDDDFIDLSDDYIDSAKDQADAESVADGHLLSVDELLESEAGFDEINALSDLEEIEAANDPLEEVFAADELDKTVAQIEADAFVAEEAMTEPDTASVSEPVAVDPIEEVFADTAVHQEAVMAEPKEDATSAPVAAAAVPAAAALALGGGNTIESMVTELMKPMIQEWIDANLNGIVERKVEAEIQLVANKVVKALREH